MFVLQHERDRAMARRRSLRSHWLASLLGGCAAAVVVLVAAAAAVVVAAAAVAESGPAARGCGCVEVGYGCGCCYGC